MPLFSMNKLSSHPLSSLSNFNIDTCCGINQLYPVHQQHILTLKSLPAPSPFTSLSTVCLCLTNKGLGWPIICFNTDIILTVSHLSKNAWTIKDGNFPLHPLRLKRHTTSILQREAHIKRFNKYLPQSVSSGSYEQRQNRAWKSGKLGCLR